MALTATANRGTVPCTVRIDTGWNVGSGSHGGI